MREGETATMSTSSTTDRILVPLDGSWVGMAAIPWLRAIATDTTQIVLLRAVGLTLPSAGIGAMTPETYDILQRQALDGATAYLDAVAEEIADLTPNITKVVRLGAPSDEIIIEAERQGASMIVMATEGRGVAGRIIAGSVADRVARVASVPVMLVPARSEPAPFIHDPAPVGRIVVPCDGSELARNAIPVAATLAGRLDVPVHLLRVVPTAEQMVARQGEDPSDRIYQRIARAVPGLPVPTVDRAWYEGYIRAIRGALESEASKIAATGVNAGSETLIGETVPRILESLMPDDVIVMTSHGEGGVRRWLMGSVAEQLVHEAVAPVVLVPAPGREQLAG